MKQKFKVQMVKMLKEFVGPWLRVSAGCYEEDKWTCGLHKRRGAFWLKEELVASTEKTAPWSLSFSVNLPVIWQPTGSNTSVYVMYECVARTEISVLVYEHTHSSRDLTIRTKKINLYMRNNFGSNSAQQICAQFAVPGTRDFTLQWRKREAAVSVCSNFKRVGLDKRVALFCSSSPSKQNPGAAINCFIPLATIIRCPKG